MKDVTSLRSLVEQLEPRQLLASVPAGFTLTPLVSGLSAPTAEDIAPDGRIFVAEQGGDVRIVQNGTLLAKPFVSLTVDSQGERGVIGVTLDPNFKTNHFVYVYYTTDSPVTHNRLSRFTESNNVAVPGSEKVLLDLNPLSFTNHNGGGLHFGVDGELYLSVGENHTPSNAQTLSNLLGKVLRLNPDGSIPTDNPFYNIATGNNRAIWAMGLRNPFTFGVQPGTGKIFIDDVGESTWEEINVGKAGANYGWPTTEGSFDQSQFPGFTEPLYTYAHGPGDSTGVAITGGTFYDPATQQFPASYRDQYFFADLGVGFIKVLNPATRTAANFGSGFNQPVDLDVAADGSLYVLSHAGTIFRITHPNVSHTTTLGVIADSYVGDGSASFTNYGRTTQLLARTGATGTNRITYLQFDLSLITTISSATLRLFGSLSQEGNNSLAVGVFAAGGSFSENKLIWSNRPAAVGSALAKATITTASRRWYQWDLTSYLRQQRQAGKTVVTLVLKGLTTSTSAAFFSSREAGVNGPQLVINN
ncbi:MAG TPA: PQQ-dependent sugar dehydrogenase [Humisphaera sp.]|jgi:glucose/arabinose dehydrogenase|nr:PQQ-dependent sugar dehydrogenase [Humisphaera sp.]